MLILKIKVIVSERSEDDHYLIRGNYLRQAGIENMPQLKSLSGMFRQVCFTLACDAASFSARLCGCQTTLSGCRIHGMASRPLKGPLEDA